MRTESEIKAKLEEKRGQYQEAAQTLKDLDKNRVAYPDYFERKHKLEILTTRHGAAVAALKWVLGE
jgi:hypothetical protein